jgi:predicted RNA methylase
VGHPSEPRGVAGAADTAKPFTAYDIQACLYDVHRVKYLRAAIVGTIKPGDVVVDAGSGTGLLGLLAARAGAKRVYCLELNPDFKHVIEANAANNGLRDRIIVETADATAYVPPEPIDVVVSEVISAGFFYEPQLQIVNHLRDHLRPGGRMVPCSMRNYVELIHAQEQLYELTFTYDSRFTDLEEDRSLTTTACYLSTDFAGGTGTAEMIDERVTLQATDSGVANAIRITYDVEFMEGLGARTPALIAGSGEAPGSWPALLNPQIIFLPHKIQLAAGEKYDVSLRYAASSYPLACETVVRPARSPNGSAQFTTATYS